MPDVMFIVPDLDIHSLVESLHAQRQSLGIGAFTLSLHRHFMRDSGVRTEAEVVARANRATGTEREQYVVAILDYHGSGAHDVEKCAERMEQKLSGITFPRENVLAVFIEPELEAWLLSDVPGLARTMGLSYAQLQSFIGDANTRFPDDIRRQLQHVLYLRNRSVRPPMDIDDVIRQIEMSKWLHVPSFKRLAATISRWFPL